MKLLLACYLATWGFIPHLLLLKKRPAATLAWLWAILFIPLLGAAAYFLFGTDRLKRLRLKRRNVFSARISPQRIPAATTDPATTALLQALPRRDRQFLQLLSRINQLPASSVETLRILSNAAEFYPALEQRIQEDWAMIGSANLDYRSMRLNFELNLLFRSPAHNAELARLLAADFNLSREIDPPVFARRPFRQKFAEAALRPLSPLL